MYKIFSINYLLLLFITSTLYCNKRIEIINQIIMNPDSLKLYIFKEYNSNKWTNHLLVDKIEFFKKYFHDGYDIVKDDSFFKDLPEKYHGSVITIRNKCNDTAQAFIFDYNDSLLMIQEPIQHNPEELAITYKIFENIMINPDSLLFYKIIDCKEDKEFTLRIINCLKREFQNNYIIIYNGWFKTKRAELEAQNFIKIKSMLTKRIFMVDFRKINGRWWIFDFSEGAQP